MSATQRFVRLRRESEVVVAAWGNHGGLLGRDRQVVSMVCSLKCVGTTMKGAPRHPLYVRSDQPLEPYEGGDSGRLSAFT